jgi:hypothetical protein
MHTSVEAVGEFDLARATRSWPFANHLIFCMHTDRSISIEMTYNCGEAAAA